MVYFKDQQIPFVSNAATKRMKTKIETKKRGKGCNRIIFLADPKKITSGFAGAPLPSGTSPTRVLARQLLCSVLKWCKWL